LKDLYQILGVQKNATEAEIKKAFRRLAHQYHPDKNRDIYSAAQFQAIREAYDTLSNSWSRARYDQDRSYTAGSTSQQTPITPEWLLGISLQLTQSLAKMDAASINYSNLQAYILLILSDPHMAILQHHKETEKNKAIVLELIKACNRLPVKYLTRIQTKLVQLAENDEQLKNKVIGHYASRIRQYKRQRLFPLIVIIITMLLMALMMLT